MALGTLRSKKLILIWGSVRIAFTNEVTFELSLKDVRHIASLTFTSLQSTNVWTIAVSVTDACLPMGISVTLFKKFYSLVHQYLRKTCLILPSEFFFVLSLDVNLQIWCFRHFFLCPLLLNRFQFPFASCPKAADKNWLLSSTCRIWNSGDKIDRLRTIIWNNVQDVSKEFHNVIEIFKNSSQVCPLLPQITL